MNPCDECSIDDKVYTCCGRYPETGETACMSYKGKKTMQACPYLSDKGACKIYGRRPLGCRTFFCQRFDPCSGIDWGQLNDISAWLKNAS